MVISPASAARVIGASALGFSVLYLLTDLAEAIQGGFSTWQLAATLAAEAAVPFFVIGLWLLQRPRIGKLGAVGAFAYAYCYLFFCWTVVYALAEGTASFDDLSGELGPWMTLHGAIMLLAGLAFGYAVLKAGVLPRWTALALMVGVVLVVATRGAPEGAQILAVAIRDLGFAAMGAVLLFRGPTQPTSASFSSSRLRTKSRTAPTAAL